MQNMQRYFGFKISINDDIDPTDEAILRDQAKKIVDAENLDLDKYQVYLHQLIVSAEETHFGVGGGIPGRLHQLIVEFHVNLKQRKAREIQFFNHVIDTAVPKTVKPYFSTHKIGYEIPSEYFRSVSWFQNAIIAFVNRNLRSDRRKIKVQVKVAPTAAFRALLHDVTEAHAETHLDLRFQKDVQLRLPLGDFESAGGGGRMTSNKPGNTFIVQGGTVYGFGENVSIRDIFCDARAISGLTQLAKRAEEEGKSEDAAALTAAAKAAQQGEPEKTASLLKKCSDWSIKTAEKLGVSAAEAAIKAAINSQF